MKTIGLLLGAAALIGMTGISSAQRPSVPVFIESEDGTGPCSGGVVVDLDPHGDGFLAVKAGPGLNYARIDKLYHNGAQVWICSERGDWWGIVYDWSGKWAEKCNVSESIAWPKRMPYTGPCRSGWVHKRWVKGVAG
jgi:hypothetical protein